MEMFRLPTKFLGGPRGSRAGRNRVQQGDARGEGRDSSEHVSRGESSAFDRGGGVFYRPPPPSACLSSQSTIRPEFEAFAEVSRS